MERADIWSERSKMFIRNEAKIMSRVHCESQSVTSEQGLILSSCCLSSMRRNSVFEVLRVKRLADIQEYIACKGVCVNEKHSRDRERCPARPYSSSSADTSGVVLRHRAAAAAYVCLTTAAATFCTPEASRWVSAQPVPIFKGFTKRFF